MDSNEHGAMEQNEEHLETNISIYYTHETELYAESYDAMNMGIAVKLPGHGNPNQYHLKLDVGFYLHRKGPNQYKPSYSLSRLTPLSFLVAMAPRLSPSSRTSTVTIPRQCPNLWCKSAICCYLLLLIRTWGFVAFDVCILWAWALQVFWCMPCHLYRGVWHVFLWSLWWLAQACKLGFVMFMFSGTWIFAKSVTAVILLPCIHVATERSMLMLEMFSKDVL